MLLLNSINNRIKIYTDTCIYMYIERSYESPIYNKIIYIPYISNYYNKKTCGFSLFTLIIRLVYLYILMF